MPDIDEIKVMTKLTEYSSKKGFFGLEFLWVAHEQVEAEAWWSGLCKHTELSKLAARVLSLPVTTAACEKSFSLHSHTLSNKRNHLTNELAGKLDFVNHNLKFLEPINLANSKAKLISTKGFEEVAHFRSACSQIGTEQHSQRTDKFDVLRGRLLGNHNDFQSLVQLGNNFVREAEGCRWELKARNSAVRLCASYDSSCFVAAGLVVDLAT